MPNAGRRALLATILLLGILSTLAATRAAEEPPMLAQAVTAGRLPPLAERLPEAPRRDLPTWPGWTSGRYGGELHMLDRGGRDARALVIFGYARLVTWQRAADGGIRLVPDILQRVDVEAGRIFTLQLRRGHRWSDGAPFTAEDFRFWWDDVANNRELSPAGPPPELPEALRLLELYEDWSGAPDEAARREAWQEMLLINADQVFTIGLVGGVLQPVVRNARLRNLPERANFLYEPGAYFGITRPDTYWFE